MAPTAKSSKSYILRHMLKSAPQASALQNRLDRSLSTSYLYNMQQSHGNPTPAKQYRLSKPKPPHTNQDFDCKLFIKSARVHLKFTINNSYSRSTSDGHSYAIKRFLAFAAKCGVAKQDALPCNQEMLCLWIADGVGRTGIGTATANIAALSAWHRSRGLPFGVPPQIKTIKRALKLHWPEEKQQKPPRPPISPRMVRLLALAWSGGSTREKCALAMAVAAFTGQMRLGELLPASSDKVTCDHLPTRGNWSLCVESRRSSSIFLPWSKTTGKAGTLVNLPTQATPLNPTRAICHHLVASVLGDSALLCEYREGDLVKVLDKKHFMAMCNRIWSSHGFQRITGHSFRIGGTTSLLLSGVDAEIVKHMGRWSSDAFKLYWRKVEVLFAKHASDVNWVDFDI
jgi:hypothetical protein